VAAGLGKPYGATRPSLVAASPRETLGTGRLAPPPLPPPTQMCYHMVAHLGVSLFCLFNY
jgi:hypothetical protein